MVTVTIDSHREYPQDGTAPLDWPSATLTANPGDYILANIDTVNTVTDSNGNSITFGANTSSMPGPYTSSASGTNYGTQGYNLAGPYVNMARSAIDLTDEALAYVEVLGYVDEVADAHTGEYTVFTRAGHHPIHGGHIRPKAAGKRHLHPHHQTKHHHHNNIFSTSATNTGTGSCTVSWAGGTLQYDDGTTGVTISAGSISGVAKDSYIVYNNTSGTVDGIAANSIGSLAGTTDFTTDARIQHHIIGRISSAVDPQTGQYYFEGWHVGSHQHHGGHIASKAVSRRHHVKSHQMRGHFRNGKFAMTGGTGSPALTTVAHDGSTTYFAPDDGSGEIAMPGTLISGNALVGATPPLIGVWPAVADGGAAAQTVFYNPVTNQWASSKGNVDFTTDTWINWMKVGHLSSATDSNGNYIFHSYFTGSNEVSDKHHSSNSVNESHIQAGVVHGGEASHKNHVAAQAIDGGTAHDHIAHKSLHGGESGNADHHADQSHARRHHAYTIPTRYHFGNVIFKISGSGNPWTITPTAQYGTPMLLKDNGDVIVNPISTTAFTCSTGQYIYYNVSNNTYSVQNNGLDLTNPANDIYYHVGRLSDGTDNFTHLPIISGWHQGSHVVHANHIAPSAIGGVHVGPASFGQSKMNWLYTLGATQINNGDAAILPNSGKGGWTISNVLSVTYGMSTSVQNAMHSYGWAIAVGESTVQNASVTPFSSYSQSLNGAYGNGGSQDLAYSPDNAIWGDSSSGYGIILQNVILSGSSLQIRWRNVTYNLTAVTQPYMYLNLKIYGMDTA